MIWYDIRAGPLLCNVAFGRQTKLRQALNFFRIAN